MPRTQIGPCVKCGWKGEVPTAQRYYPQKVKPWATIEAIKAAGPPIDMETLLELSDMLEICEKKAVIVQKIYKGYLVRKRALAYISSCVSDI